MPQKKYFTTTETANAVIWGNGYNVAMPWVKASGFRTRATQYSDQSLPNLAEDYLANAVLKSRDPELETSIEFYLGDLNLKMISLGGYEDLSGVETVPLPENVSLSMELGEAIAKRRSVRNFTGDKLPLNYLATLLRVANGISSIGETSLAEGEVARLHFRTAPSGGGLYPIDLYLMSFAIDGLKKGIYRYNAVLDKLILMSGEEQFDALLRSFEEAGELVKNAYPSAIFLLVAQPWRTMRKYGDLGLKFIFHEGGAITQNLHLAVTALGLGSVDCASYLSDVAHDALGIDGIYRTVIHTVLVGYP